VTPDDIVWTFSGVRPLYDDGAQSATAATRDYVLSLDDRGAVLLNVFGGKITTYRKLAEDALAKLAPHLRDPGRPWTAGAPLPGGDFAVNGVEGLIADLRFAHPFVTEPWASRLIRAYGTDAAHILGDAKAATDLGRDFGATLTEAELRWLMEKEYARSAEDVVWRRSKLGLRLTADQIAAIETFMREATGRLAAE
jgi:Glycerol-3-phosphate dehydrogenase